MCIQNEKRNNNSSKSTQTTHHRTSRKNQHRRNNFPRQQYRKVTDQWGKLSRSASDPSFELRRREEKSLLQDFHKLKLSKEEVIKRAKKAVVHLPSIIANLSVVSSRLANSTVAAGTAAAAAIDAYKQKDIAEMSYAIAKAVNAAQRGAATARRIERRVANTPDICTSIIASSYTRKSLRTKVRDEALDDAVSAARLAERFAGITAGIAEIISISASAAIGATAAAVSAIDAEKTAVIEQNKSVIANRKAVDIADRAYSFAKRFLNSLNSFLARRTQMPPPPLPQISVPRQQYQHQQSQCSPINHHCTFPQFRWATQNYNLEYLSRIQDEIFDRVDSIKSKVLSKLEISEIKGKLESIRTILSEKMKLEIYGSYRTGLCLPTSDLDLCLEVESDPSYNKWQLIDERLRIMRLLDKHLRNETWVREFTPLLSVKHPVLKLIVVLNNMKKVKLDITVEFKKKNGVPSDPCLAAELILQYKQQYAALEPMALIVKQFFVEWDLVDTHHGCPNSYCIVIMIVTFLQYAYNAYSNNGGTQAQPKVGGLLIDFFNFYGYHFNYLQMGIRYNYKEKYHLLANIDDVRSSRHKRKSSKYGPCLVIDDPIVEENNVGSHATQFPRVKQAFQDALTNFRFLIKKSGVTNVINKSYLEAFLNKEISLQRHTPVQSSNYSMQIPRQYSDQRAPRWEGIPIHSRAGYYVPNFFHEADHTFFQPQILSSGPYY